MGNTTITDSITGEAMSLSPGFIPVGMKEHGGILYIASYNPTTQESELGSIPGPIYEYEPIKASEVTINQALIEGQKDYQKLAVYEISDLYDSTPTLISSDKYYYLGDSIFPIFDYDFGSPEISTYDRTIRVVGRYSKTITFNVLTKINNANQKDYGMFNLVPWIKPIKATDLIRFTALEENKVKYYKKSNYELIDNEWDYWFTNTDDFDETVTKNAGLFTNIPNVQGCQIYVSVEPVESVLDVQLFTNKTTQLESPIYYIKDNG